MNDLDVDIKKMSSQKISSNDNKKFIKMRMGKTWLQVQVVAKSRIPGSLHMLKQETPNQLVVALLST